MSEATALKVPAHYAEGFRKAVIYEIGLQAQFITDDKVLVDNYCTRATADDAREIQACAELLARDLALLDQLVGDGDAEVKGDPDTLAHVCQSLADKVFGRELELALNTDPMDEKQADAIHWLLDAVTWAVDSAEAQHLFEGAGKREAVTS